MDSRRNHGATGHPETSVTQIGSPGSYPEWQREFDSSGILSLITKQYEAESLQKKQDGSSSFLESRRLSRVGGSASFGTTRHCAMKYIYDFHATQWIWTLAIGLPICAVATWLCRARARSSFQIG